MLLKRLFIALSLVVTLPSASLAKEIDISNRNIKMKLNCDGRLAAIVNVEVNGQHVITSKDGVYTSVTVGDKLYSSLSLLRAPGVRRKGNVVTVSDILYGDAGFNIKENWIFTIGSKNINWKIERSTSKPLLADESASPVFNFDHIDTWESAYQGFGGVAWFYLFNEKLCTYGVHTRSSDFWNSKTGNGLNITVDAPGKQVAMKYTRTNNDKLSYTISTSAKELIPKLDSGTNRRRFTRGTGKVWAPFKMATGTSSQAITLTYFNFEEKYGRGDLKGVNSKQVGDVLNTIARIGVIDSLHFGGNSWHTPYGPICLHEQYIAQLGLAINDPKYLRGYASTLDYYRDHAIKPDGRVYPRWAYTNEDAMPGKFNKEGFYEAQWGILMDSNPDFVTNVAELYDMNGDKVWVKTHQLSCERALDWIIKRDENKNGLVEMTNSNTAEKKSSDWIDIIWASYENALVNAKLYHALLKWADIEHQLANNAKARYYSGFAAKLKASFNKPTSQGGFWDEEKGYYDYWRDKDQTIHGRNLVTPVNFMAITYGICDDKARIKTVLDKIEGQMPKENLFFWPLCFYPYEDGEGKEYQYPFPIYENGDLFLSWGSVAVKAYADYKPELALKYVRNVLKQYGKDGLAFQRYGRVKQDGLGDDILSGNSLAIVGLYQAIYGINPMYNRFYLEPHITADLAGTKVNYNYRGKRLVIGLEEGSYSVSSGNYSLSAGEPFGFNYSSGKILYFNKSNPAIAMEASAINGLQISIKNWSAAGMQWQQTTQKEVTYTFHQLKPKTAYKLTVNGKAARTLVADAAGKLVIVHTPAAATELITLSK